MTKNQFVTRDSAGLKAVWLKLLAKETRLGSKHTFYLMFRGSTSEACNAGGAHKTLPPCYSFCPLLIWLANCWTRKWASRLAWATHSAKCVSQQLPSVKTGTRELLDQPGSAQEALVKGHWTKVKSWLRPHWPYTSSSELCQYFTGIALSSPTGTAQ